MIRILTDLWRRVFPPTDTPAADLFMGSSHDPYREETPTPDHDPDCEACAHLERIDCRWKAPEDLLSTGVPVDCVSFKPGISVDVLHGIAEEAGLVLQGGDTAS